MAPSGTVTRGKGKASSTAASRPASRSGSPPADDANTTIVPGTITLAQFRDPGDLPSQIPGFPSTSYLGQTASSSASIIEGISSSTPFEHADDPALSHEPTPAYRSYTHYRPAPSAVPADTGRRSPAASADHLGATDNFNVQSLLVLSYIDRIFDRLVPFLQPQQPQPPPAQQPAQPQPIVPRSPSALPPPVPPLRAPTQSFGGFIPPYTTNPAYGASPPSLATFFTDIPAATLQNVLSHNLPAEDLYKLDTRLKFNRSKQEFSLTSGKLEVTSATGAVKDYPTPSSVFVPLSRYCLIMQKHTAQLADLGDLPSYFTAYMHHFHVLVTEYEWSAVRNYHMNFFDARLDDMKRGIYDTWAWPDPLLSGQFLYAHARPVSSSASSKAKKQPSNNETQICLNWNSGKCTSPCPNHRIHACSKCKKDHLASACPGSA